MNSRVLLRPFLWCGIQESSRIVVAVVRVFLGTSTVMSDEYGRRTAVFFRAAGVEMKKAWVLLAMAQTQAHSVNLKARTLQYFLIAASYVEAYRPADLIFPRRLDGNSDHHPSLISRCVTVNLDGHFHPC